MKFTKEEISLCKQVAEKYRKEIKCGDWILRNGELRLNLDGKLAWLEDGKQDIIITITAKEEIIPLWTEHDCLEYLEIECIPLKMQIKDDSYARLQGWRWRVSWGNPNAEEGKPWGGSINAPTLLEACLKAILAVLKEGV